LDVKKINKDPLTLLLEVGFIGQYVQVSLFVKSTNRKQGKAILPAFYSKLFTLHSQLLTLSTPNSSDLEDHQVF